MKAVIQRVTKASVTIEGQQVANINSGVLVLLGIANDDTHEDIKWLSNKIANLRIFLDDDGVMNMALLQTQGDAIVVSQFTLYASTKKGHRPSYIRAAKPEIAIPLYEAFVKQLEIDLDKKVQTGQFGADMKVELCNDGPVTIIMDTKDKT
ncbi:MAG: D-tyrosyl-tRNA(Tyr) deacylase [Glaciecola sp.]